MPAEAVESSAFTATRTPLPDLDAALATLAENVPHLDSHARPASRRMSPGTGAGRFVVACGA